MEEGGKERGAVGEALMGGGGKDPLGHYGK